MNNNNDNKNNNNNNNIKTIIGKKCLRCKTKLTMNNTEVGQACRLCLKCLNIIIDELNKGYISLSHHYYSNNTNTNEEDVYYLQRSLIQNKKINVPKYILSLLNKPNVLKDEAFILYNYKVIIEYEINNYDMIRFRFIDSNIDIYKTRNVNNPYCPYSYRLTKKEFIKDRYKLFELL